MFCVNDVVYTANGFQLAILGKQIFSFHFELIIFEDINIITVASHLFSLNVLVVVAASRPSGMTLFRRFVYTCPCRQCII